MDRNEFEAVIAADPNLSEPIVRAAKAARPGQYTMVAEAAAVALMFPIVRYVLVHIGLPWLHELKSVQRPPAAESPPAGSMSSIARKASTRTLPRPPARSSARSSNGPPTPLPAPLGST